MPKAPFAKRPKASVLQTDISQVRILEGVRACSSVAEPRADNAVTEVRFFTGIPNSQATGKSYAWFMQAGAARRKRSRDRTRSVKPEWRGSGLLTRPHVARNHPGPPFRTSDPSGKGPGLLNRRASFVGSSPTWSSNTPRSWRNWQTRHFERVATMSVRLRPSAPDQPCDASGEATPPSTKREGFDFPTGRQFSEKTDFRLRMPFFAPARRPRGTRPPCWSRIPFMARSSTGRARVSETRGCRFESCRADQFGG